MEQGESLLAAQEHYDDLHLNSLASHVWQASTAQWSTLLGIYNGHISLFGVMWDLALRSMV
jgi:hypothetical protein